ncbi:MAG: TIGR02996 domain-containing protein [Gemmatales bacterium]
MQADRRLLLRYVLQNIHDDAPRLVYANWLAENGAKERAEIIRTQICSGKEGHQFNDYGPYLMASALGILVGFPSSPRGLWLGQFWLQRGFVRKIKLFLVPFMRLSRACDIRTDCDGCTEEDEASHCGRGRAGTESLAEAKVVATPAVEMVSDPGCHQVYAIVTYNGWPSYALS